MPPSFPVFKKESRECPHLSSARGTFTTVVEWFEGSESHQCLICSVVKVVSPSNKRDVDKTKIGIARLEKGIYVILWMCQTTSKTFRSFKETYVCARQKLKTFAKLLA